MTKRVPRGPSIDEHPNRGLIEADLARGVAVRVVAKRYGISKSAAARYRMRLPPQLRAASLRDVLKPGADLASLRAEMSEGILKMLAMQNARLLLIQDRAMEKGADQVAISAAARVQHNVELVGKYLGEFASHQIRTEVNVLVQPSYLELRAGIMRALAPFPAARQAVAAAFHTVETRTSDAPQLPPPVEVSDAA